MRRVFHYHRTTAKQLHLLLALLLQRIEILVMLVADIRDNAYVRTNNRFQSLHLARLTDSCLKNRKKRFSARR